MHETPSRDRGDGRATGQPETLQPEAYFSVPRKVRDPRTPGRTAISAVAAGGSCIMRVNSLACRKACRTLHHGPAGRPDHYKLIHGATMQPCRTDRPGSGLRRIPVHGDPRSRSFSASCQSARPVGITGKNKVAELPWSGFAPSVQTRSSSGWQSLWR